MLTVWFTKPSPSGCITRSIIHFFEGALIQYLWARSRPGIEPGIPFVVMSGEQKPRHQPDGKEGGTDPSLSVTTLKERQEPAQEEITKCNEGEACTSELTTINDQLSDDSLDDDTVTDNLVVNAVAPDSNAHTYASVAANVVSSDSTEGVKQIKANIDASDDKKVSFDSNKEEPVAPKLSNDHNSNTSDNVTKATASKGSLHNGSLKLSQSCSSTFASSSSRIPVLKGSKGKPSALVEPHKASATLVSTTTPGELSHQEMNSPSLNPSEYTDTPVSIAMQEVPSSDSLHPDGQVSEARKEAKKASVATQPYHKGWSSQNSTQKPSQLPVAVKRRRQDGRVLKNSNSFSSYVHEQMAITMAMMEANFEGVGLSNTQQERVEELRAGLDSFSLTNITAPKQKLMVFKNGRHHHDDHANSSHRDTYHRKHNSEAYYRASHDGRAQLLYRSQSYSTNADCAGYGGTLNNTRRGSELSHSDSFRMKRSGLYLQQQLDRRGSYLQQSKLAQSIKSLRPPKLQPLPRKKSSNYLDNYMKSSKSSKPAAAGGRNSNQQWSPAHAMPPLDESTPINHTHYWDPTVNALGSHMMSDGSYGDGYYCSKQHHYSVLPNIGETYSNSSLHPVRSYYSYQQHCPGPPHADAPRPGGHYYTQHGYWKHRN